MTVRRNRTVSVVAGGLLPGVIVLAIRAPSAGEVLDLCVEVGANVVNIPSLAHTCERRILEGDRTWPSSNSKENADFAVFFD